MGILLAFLVGLSDCCPTNQTVAASDFYSRALAMVGHDSVVICRTTDTNALRRIVRGLDMILLTGGEDVAPDRYGAKPAPRLGGVNRARDEYDFALLAACHLEQKPVLGICRGCQVLNVAFGGTLIQDIPSEYGPPDGGAVCSHNFNWYAPTNPPLHLVTFASGSRLAKVWREGPLAVNSFHHQSVRDVAPGFNVVGRAQDGIVEAIEHESLPFYGVQFHPEKTVSQNAPGYDFARYYGFFHRLPELIMSKRGISE